MSDTHWKKPLAWNRKAKAAGERHRVFCASMADVLEVLPGDHPSWQDMENARARLFGLMMDTPHLDWLVLTKRPENFYMLSHLSNIWIGVTAENQEQADIRIPLLVSQKWAQVRFVSYEPALGPIRFNAEWFTGAYEDLSYGMIVDRIIDGVDWLICGAESGPGARPMDLDWVRLARDQCALTSTPFMFKQKLEAGKKVSLPLLDGVQHAAFPSVLR